MSDAANAAQRNLYSDPSHTRSTTATEYSVGRGMKYSESLRKLSWPINTDVPALGQYSASIQLPNLKQIYGVTNSQILLHPTRYTKLHHTDHLSFSKSMGELGVGLLANPEKDVFSRLYLGSRSMHRAPSRQVLNRFETAADVAFSNGAPIDCLDLYTKAIKAAKAGVPNLFAYEKRCSAYAELGRYREALADAQFILDWHDDPRSAEHGAAAARVKTIKDFLRRVDNCEPGYHQATSTLICLLRPREHRQLVQSNPATYGRPETAERIGRGLTPTSTAAKLLGWDKDNDGDVDLDEFYAGVATLGYKVKKKEKSAFAGRKGDQRGFI